MYFMKHLNLNKLQILEHNLDIVYKITSSFFVLILYDTKTRISAKVLLTQSTLPRSTFEML